MSRSQAAVGTLALAGAWLLTFALRPWADESVSDIFVYRSYAEPFLDGVLPYRDVAFEYPPLAAPLIALGGLAGTDEATYRIAFAALMLAAALGLAAASARLARHTGASPIVAGAAIVALPLLAGAVVRTHFDLVPVLLAVAGLVLVARPSRGAASTAAGFALLGAGAAVKAFPLLVAAMALAWLAGRGERRALLAGAGALAAVLAATLAASLSLSPGGAADAVRYHAERPVQVESTPALLLRAAGAAGAERPRAVKSHRSDGLEHPAAGAIVVAGGVLTLGLVALIALLAARRPGRRALVLAALAAVAVLPALGKVFSPQFVIWLAPLGALALAWRMRALATAVAAATVLTLAEFPGRYFDVVDGDPTAVAIVAARNVAVLAALALAIAALRREPVRRSREPEAAAARSTWPDPSHPPGSGPRSATDPRPRARSAPASSS